MLQYYIYYSTPPVAAAAAQYRDVGRFGDYALCVEMLCSVLLVDFAEILTPLFTT